MKKIILLIVIAMTVGLTALIYNWQLPCGGKTDEGALWDGTCAYGPLLIENLKQGNFFLPFGYN